MRKIKKAWKLWLDSTLVKTIRTGAQTALGVLGAGATPLLDVDYVGALSVTGASMLACFLFYVTTMPSPFTGKGIEKDGDSGSLYE